MHACFLRCPAAAQALGNTQAFTARARARAAAWGGAPGAALALGNYASRTLALALRGPGGRGADAAGALEVEALFAGALLSRVVLLEVEGGAGWRGALRAAINGPPDNA